MGDGIDVFGINGMPRSTDGGTWGKVSMTRWNPFIAIVVVVVEVRLGPIVGGIESFPNWNQVSKAYVSLSEDDEALHGGDFFLPIG